MDIHLSEKAQRDLERLARGSPKVEQTVRNHLRRLPEAYRHDKQLRGAFSGYRRHRVGDYRVIYRADPARTSFSWSAFSIGKTCTMCEKQ